MYHIRSLPGDVRLTSVKSCRSPTKIFIKTKEKCYSSCKFIHRIFLNKKKTNCHDLNRLIKKIDECDSITWKSGSGKPRTAHHEDNIDAVADLVQSQADKLQTHHSVRLTDRSWDGYMTLICGHFEYKFWTYDCQCIFLCCQMSILVFVNVIDINMFRVLI